MSHGDRVRALLLLAVLIVLVASVPAVAQQPPNASFDFSPARPLVNETITFDASSSTDPDGGTIVDYRWGFGDGTNGTGVVATHAYTAAGTYQVTLGILDDEFMPGFTQRPVRVFAAPVGAFTVSPASPIAGLPVGFDGTGSTDADGTITSYDWTFGDGATGSGPQPGHTYSSAGTYQVTLTVMDNDGFSDMETQSVVVGQSQTPVASFTFTPASPVTGEVVTFDGSGSADPDGIIVSYGWSFGDGGIGGGGGPVLTHVYSTAGTFQVVLNVQDNTGLNGTTFRTLVVSAPNMAPFPSFAVVTPSLRAGESITFDATRSTDADGQIVEYRWTFGDGATTNETDPNVTHVYAMPGTYTVSLTVVDDDGATATTTRTITVSAAAAPEGIPPAVLAGLLAGIAAGIGAVAWILVRSRRPTGPGTTVTRPERPTVTTTGQDVPTTTTTTCGCKLTEHDPEPYTPIGLSMCVVPKEAGEWPYAEPIYLHAHGWDYDRKKFTCRCYEGESVVKIPLGDDVYYDWELTEDIVTARTLEGVSGPFNAAAYFDIGDDPNTKGTLVTNGNVAAYLPPAKAMVHVLIDKEGRGLGQVQGTTPTNKRPAWLLYHRKVVIKCHASNKDAAKAPDPRNTKTVRLTLQTCIDLSRGRFFLRVVPEVDAPDAPSTPEKEEHQSRCKITWKWKVEPALKAEPHLRHRIFPEITEEPLVPSEKVFFQAKEADSDTLEVTCEAQTIKKVYADPLDFLWRSSEGTFLNRILCDWAQSPWDRSVIFKSVPIDLKLEDRGCYRFKHWRAFDPKKVQLRHSVNDTKDWCVQAPDGYPEWSEDRQIRECKETTDPAHVHQIAPGAAGSCSVHQVDNVALACTCGQNASKTATMRRISDFFCKYDGRCLNQHAKLGDLSKIAACFADGAHSYDHEFHVISETMMALFGGASAFYVRRAGLLAVTGIDGGDLVFTQSPAQTQMYELWHEVIHALQDAHPGGMNRWLEIDTYYMQWAEYILSDMGSFEDLLRNGCGGADPGMLRYRWDRILASVYWINNTFRYERNGYDARTPMWQMWLDDFATYAGFKVDWKGMLEGFRNGMCHKYASGVPLPRFLPRPPEEVYPRKGQPPADHEHVYSAISPNCAFCSEMNPEFEAGP